MTLVLNKYTNKAVEFVTLYDTTVAIYINYSCIYTLVHMCCDTGKLHLSSECTCGSAYDNGVRCRWCVCYGSGLSITCT